MSDLVAKRQGPSVFRYRRKGAGIGGNGRPEAAKSALASSIACFLGIFLIFSTHGFSYTCRAHFIPDEAEGIRINKPCDCNVETTDIILSLFGPYLPVNDKQVNPTYGSNKSQSIFTHFSTSMLTPRPNPKNSLSS